MQLCFFKYLFVYDDDDDDDDDDAFLSARVAAELIKRFYVSGWFAQMEILSNVHLIQTVILDILLLKLSKYLRTFSLRP